MVERPRYPSYSFHWKDNIVFHCIIFPVMLKAEGTFILPDNVPANEFLNLEGEKYLLRATGLFGCMNISKISPTNKTCYAMS